MHASQYKGLRYIISRTDVKTYISNLTVGLFVITRIIRFHPLKIKKIIYYRINRNHFCIKSFSSIIISRKFADWSPWYFYFYFFYYLNKSVLLGKIIPKFVYRKFFDAISNYFAQFFKINLWAEVDYSGFVFSGNIQNKPHFFVLFINNKTKTNFLSIFLNTNLSSKLILYHWDPSFNTQFE